MCHVELKSVPVGGQCCLSEFSKSPPDKAQLRALSPCKQPGLLSTLIYIVVGLIWLTTALMGWNALHTILALGVWQTLCMSQ